MLPTHIFKSAAIGMILPIGVLALGCAIGIGPVFIAYIAPGFIFLQLISKWTFWIYLLDPDGGPANGVFLLLVSATFFWAVLFGAAHFAWVSLRLGRR